ncbi:class I SAM-dependent methyltransferase [Salmonella enterica]|nr:class I SAM-dependent methyltransferase [Salmonella enterica subsp. enterica serovar Florida]EIK0049918.1 class I SAM-dependent methyltransferase [Salmonella enterica]ECF4164742.1 class I SAM-dependent methyltransferase [Salmonella enterica subsp. enterica serovar Florida]ECW2472574.1 class I SAM-dependent methyltransferase [Salmonella enterica subsp. enterica serovar Florida]EIQ6924839.1 class I SAM-dependent methyltransferase [Salmonella enterica]
MERNTHDGAKVYNPLTLKLYDWWVLGVSNRFAWRCATDKHLLPFFLQNTGKKHLDIGVGTGYYLAHVPEDCFVSMMDLNSSSLNAAASRVGKGRIQYIIQHDVFTSYPDSLYEQFDSVSMFYLLHCLPGDMSGKSPVIRNATKSLTNNGKLFGATILGAGVEHNTFGQKLMNVYNGKGIFSNRNDSSEGLRQILSEHFMEVSITIKGTVALFSASGKK